jgi:subtilisin family serine protease
MYAKTNLLLVAALAMVTALSAQHKSAGTDKQTVTKLGLITSTDLEHQKPSDFSRITEDSSTERRLLVMLKNEPLATVAKPRASIRAIEIKTEHATFRQHFQDIRGRHSGRGGRTSSRISLEYNHVFNGFAVIATKDEERAIRELPYVQSVTEDRVVQSTDQASNAIINADKVWSSHNITGKNVVIAIIDSGIDYNHPDLGGGFGPGFKVIGGFDFANNDADPLDDFGHGTHVAGIAAANGTIKGVAPDAKMIAFKVLGSDGWGLDSWILAGIEDVLTPTRTR